MVQEEPVRGSGRERLQGNVNLFSSVSSTKILREAIRYFVIQATNGREPVRVMNVAAEIQLGEQSVKGFLSGSCQALIQQHCVNL